MELNPEIDLSVDVSNLNLEFRQLSLLLYRYSQQRAKVDTQRDIAKAKLKETRAIAYKRIRSDKSVKHTENSMEAELDTDPVVLEAQMKYLRAEHDSATWSGAVESMRAKKDMLIQIGADLRKDK